VRRAAVGLGTAFAVGAWLACTSSSPFTRPPASIAVDEPCRFMGTFHKESRVRIEELRMCRVITDAQWGCLATELKALDVAFTAECRERTVRYAEIASDQHDRYVRCLPEGPKAVARCAVLSDDATCIAEHCS
jgi:hypothetical protein